MADPRATLGIIGGSGLYRLIGGADAETIDVATPYGPARVTLGGFAGRRVAFLPRHGSDHSIAPHLIGYRANVWALASLGVAAILTSAAVGGLSDRCPPGALVVPSQLIDRTGGRGDTFFDRPGDVQHLTAADPFDPALLAIVSAALSDAGEEVVDDACVVVIQGPRFSTRAESLWFKAAGADIVNMTLYPEAVLAAELGIGFATLAFVTDSDAGASHVEAVDAATVFARLAEAQPRIVAGLAAVARAIPDDYRAPTLIPADAVARVLARPAAEPRPSIPVPVATGSEFDA